jgi:hypothetical protein
MSATLSQGTTVSFTGLTFVATRVSVNRGSGSGNQRQRISTAHLGSNPDQEEPYLEICWSNRHARHQRRRLVLDDRDCCVIGRDGCRRRHHSRLRVVSVQVAAAGEKSRGNASEPIVVLVRRHHLYGHFCVRPGAGARDREYDICVRSSRPDGNGSDRGVFKPRLHRGGVSWLERPAAAGGPSGPSVSGDAGRLSLAQCGLPICICRSPRWRRASTSFVVHAN